MKQEAFLRRLFKNKSISVVANNGGQAVIEYILLLVIIVSLVMGLRGVFASMNTFMTDVIGGYVTCLMEYGELPTLGVEESELKQHKDGLGKRCPVPTFSASAAFGGSGSGVAAGTGSGGPGSGSGGSGNGKNGSNSSSSGGKSASKGGSGSDNSSSADDASRSGGSSAKSRASARGRSGSSPYSRGQISRGSGFSTADNPSDLNQGSKVKALDGPAGEEDSSWGDAAGGRRGNRRSAPARSKYKALVGKMAEEAQKTARTPRKPGSTLLAVDEGFRMTVVKRNFTPPEQKPYVEEKPEEGFQFGNFLKWIIIAGIIIACFVLFGGQVMNYSNSDS